MKQIIFIILVLTVGNAAMAQEVTPAAVDHRMDIPQALTYSSPSDSIIDVVSDLQSSFEPLSAREAFDLYHRVETLHLPEMNTYGQVMRPLMPYTWGGWQSWYLHPGLNVSLGAEVFAMFGKHAPHGAGIGQNVSLMYAIPLTNRLSLALGGYFNHLTWAHQSYQHGGLSAVLDYRFDDHWEGFIYGQKSIARSDRYPLPLYDIGHVGDRIGAGVRYYVNPTFWIEVSVESSKNDTPSPRGKR